MSRPGVEVTSRASAPPVGVPTDTSVYFALGETYMGPDDVPTRITSFDMFTYVYGGRVAASPYLYDGLDAYFHNGGQTAYVARMVDGGTEATGDPSAVTGGVGDTARVKHPGAYGNAVTLEIVTTPGVTGTSGKKGKAPEPERSQYLTYDAPQAQATGGLIATVKLDGTIMATSQPFTTNGDLAAWLDSEDWIDPTFGTPGDPAQVGTIQFTGGGDGIVPSVAPLALSDALDMLPKELGPGQLSAPGRSDLDSHGQLLAAAEATNRVALLDCAKGDDVAGLTAMAATVRGSAQDRYGSLWAPWAVIPGIAPGTTRTIPWSPIQAALCAANDRDGNPNQAVAGQWGETLWVNELETNFSPVEAELLLYAGVDTARSVYGAIQAYAFRTLVDPNGPRRDWRELNHARLNMAIVADCDAEGQSDVFAQLDGRGHTIAAFGGRMGAVCLDYFNVDALYGDDPTEAYVVNVGPDVNPPDQLEDGILHAVLSVRMSPHAELVRIEIVKYPITTTLV